jgi:hypothetical protein
MPHDKQGPPQSQRSSDRICFVVAPIGELGTEIREESDLVLNFLVVPAVSRLDLEARRAERIAEAGYLTHQIIERLLASPLVIADLTRENPNVYYELGIRHCAGLPTVLIARDGTALPADVAHQRVMFFDLTNPARLETDVDDLSARVQHALEDQYVSPVAMAATTLAMGEVSTADEALREVVAAMSDLRADVAGVVNIASERRKRLLAELEAGIGEALRFVAIEDLDDRARQIVGQLIESSLRVAEEFGSAQTRLRLRKAFRQATTIHGA